MLLMPAQRTPTRPRLVCPLLPNKLLQFFDEETEPVASPSVVCLTQRVYKESGTGILNGVPRPTTPGTRTVYAQGLVSGSSPMFDREEKNKSCFSENELEEDTRRLICDFMEKYTDFSPSWTPKDKRLSTMKRVVNGPVMKHRIGYNGMITKLSLDEQGNDMSIISGVARDLFSNGKTNWGRIASLKDMGQKERVNLVAEEISSYLLSEQRTLLIDNKVWNATEDSDPAHNVSDPEITFGPCTEDEADLNNTEIYEPKANENSTQTKTITIHCAKSLNDTTETFSDPETLARLLTVKRLLPDDSVEAGCGSGVIRDVYSAFCQEFYDRCTIGTTLKSCESLDRLDDFSSVELDDSLEALDNYECRRRA